MPEEEGMTGDPDTETTPPPSPDPTKTFGEACTASSECVSGLCLQNQCSEFCSIEVANDCREVGGFCVPMQSGQYGCWGDLATGADDDDGILRVGDAFTRNLTPLHDADLFLVHVKDGVTNVIATPMGSVDLQVEAYSPVAEPFFTGNLGAGSVEEGVAVTTDEDTYVFIVVRDVGQTTSGYTIAVSQ